MPDKTFYPGRNAIFVFGSNQAGNHGLGAALKAHRYYSARLNVGEGLFLKEARHEAGSYALPTKDRNIKTLPIEKIKEHVDKFLEVARQHPQLHFFVTRVGCGLAGLTDAEMGPLFVGAPPNCVLPHGWGKAVWREDNQ